MWESDSREKKKTEGKRREKGGFTTQHSSGSPSGNRGGGTGEFFESPFCFVVQKQEGFKNDQADRRYFPNRNQEKETGKVKEVGCNET